MIQSTMLQARYSVQHTTDGEGNDMTVLSFLDPHGGGQWTIPMSADIASELGADLQGKPAIAIAPASALPKVRG